MAGRRTCLGLCANRGSSAPAAGWAGTTRSWRLPRPPSSSPPPASPSLPCCSSAARSREFRSLALAEENLGLYHESIDKFYNNILIHPEIRTASMETLRRDLLELGKEAYERNLVPRINTPATRAELGRTYLRYALILEQLGDAKHALAQFQKALSVFETLNRTVPRRAEYLVDEAARAVRTGTLASVE